MPKEFLTPIALKRYLNLDRNDKISIEHIEKIEEVYLKHDTTINITGEYKYDSKFIKPKNIKLSLKNEHYTLLNNENKTGYKYNPKGYNIFFTTPRTKQQVYLITDYDIDQILIYNGNYEIVNRKKLNEMKRNDNIMINSKEIKISEMKNKTQNEIYIYMQNTLKEERDQLINNYDEMFNESKGEINLYKYRNLKYCSLDMLRMMSKQCK